MVRYARIAESGISRLISFPAANRLKSAKTNRLPPFPRLGTLRPFRVAEVLLKGRLVKGFVC